MKDRKSQLFLLCVVAAAVVSITAERTLPVVRIAENWSRDLRVATLTPTQPQSEQVVIIAITEETLAGFSYRSPLDRRFVSELLRTLEKKGAIAIGLDILLDQPSEPDKDIELQETLRSLSVPVVVASAEVSDGMTARQVAFMDSYIDGIRQGIPVILPDSIDGTVRAIMLRRQHEGQLKLGFMAAIATSLGIRVPDGDDMTLRFRGAPSAKIPPFATYPAHAVALLPDAWFEDRIALIGADLPLEDRHRTPFSVAAVRDAGGMPGIRLHAHALSQILDGGESPNRSMWQSILISVAFAAVGVAIVLAVIPVSIKTVALLMVTGMFWVGGLMMFQYRGEMVPLVTPTLALVLAVALAYAWRWREEQLQKRFIYDAFSKFVSPAIVDLMIEEPGRLQLGGERRNMTFLFTDVADYTTLTESIEPTLLIKIMNEYFDGTCEIVLEHGGTIEKIVGDALHVMFNAPLDQPDHPDRAVRCAIALDAYCQTFVAQQARQNIDFGLTRIGVNTGIVVVGNFGGKERFDYSATGDAINTAARLESVNKQLGTRVCVSGSTIDRCSGAMFRPVGELVLKGKSKSVAVFELVQKEDRSRCSVDEYIAAYRLLSAGDSEAEGIFRDLASRFPKDALVTYHLKRLVAGESGIRVVMKEK